MNSSNKYPGASASHSAAFDDDPHDEINLASLARVLINGRWWIISSLVIGIIFSSTYLSFATPIYMADALVQVEDDKPALSGLSEITDVLQSESAIGAEIEIIRSRSVLGDVVDDLELTTMVEPVRSSLGLRYWANGLFSRNNKWAGEAISEQSLTSFELVRFIAPKSVSELKFKISVIDDDKYSISIGDSRWVIPFDELYLLECSECGSGIEMRVQKKPFGHVDHGEIIYTPRLMAIQELSRRLSVTEVGRDTGVMRLRIEGKDPALIHRILNKVSVTYLTQNVERRSAEAEKSLSFLDEQLPKIRADLEAAENRLASFRESNRTIDLSIETESVLQEVVKIEQKLSELELKRAELARNYTDDHPLVATLNEQREQLLLEKRNLEARTQNLPEVQQDLLRYMREVEVATELYTYLLNKSQELRVVEAGTVGNVRILDTAEVMPFPVRPKSVIVYMFSCVVSLVFGVAFLALRHSFQVGITDPEEIERLLDTPVFGVLPHSQDVVKNTGATGLVSVVAPASIISESFRSLRTSLHFGISSPNAKRAAIIAISGPAPNVGKTFISANLATVLAETGKRVLFVDADMRRGDAEKIFKVSKASGLSDILRGSNFREVLQKVEYGPEFYAISRGKSPPNPAELIMSNFYGDFLDECSKEFDYIIVDTPPVLAVTDPVLLARKADSLFLVGRAGVTRLHELLECKSRFTKGGVSVTGVIVNGMTEALTATNKYGYGYGYYSYSYSSLGD